MELDSFVIVTEKPTAWLHADIVIDIVACVFSETGSVCIRNATDFIPGSSRYVSWPFQGNHWLSENPVRNFSLVKFLARFSTCQCRYTVH